jgi:spore germination protein (amino acid permease)
MAFLQIPGLLAHLLSQNGWIAAFIAIVPGYGLVLLFNYILQHSQHPFPYLLIEHLGQPLGRILGFIYVLLFLFLTSHSLRLFTDFTETNVLPGTPISIHIGVLILALVLGIRAGIGNLARLMEIIVICGLTFVLVLVLIVILQQGEIERLLPVGSLNYNNLAVATGTNLFIISKLFIVLSFGFWCGNKDEAGIVMKKAMITYVLVIGMTTLSVLMAFGGTITSVLTFPTFSMVTLVNIGNFIQNIDIIFIGVWILGIYGIAVLTWFMACYSLQIILNLHDYRFVAAGTALLVGITSILISSNILELLVLTQVFVPVLYCFFFIIIPILLFLLILLKANRSSSLESKI